MAQVPAWQAAVSEYSHPDYVFILAPEIDHLGWPKTRLVHRLTPVDPDEQGRLSEVRPEWAPPSGSPLAGADAPTPDREEKR